MREDCLLGKLRTIVLQRSGLWEVCTSVLVNPGHVRSDEHSGEGIDELNREYPTPQGLGVC